MVEIGGDQLYGQSYNPMVFVLPAIVVVTLFGEFKTYYLSINILCIIIAKLLQLL